MVAREPRRASPATKRMREALMCASSDSLRAMSAATRRQSRVALGRGARRARTLLRMRAAARLSRRGRLGRVPEGQKYWVRTEHGRTWGPYTLEALERLRGQLTEKCEASLDGATWRPGMDFPELKELLAPARKIEKKSAPPPPPPRISKAMAEAFGIKDEPVPAPAAKEATPAAPPPAQKKPPSAQRKPPPPPPAPEQPVELPQSGDLAEVSPVRLYALAAQTSASGRVQLELESGKVLEISFRRGAP